jgi:hypothetical protein
MLVCYFLARAPRAKIILLSLWHNFQAHFGHERCQSPNSRFVAVFQLDRAARWAG